MAEITARTAPGWPDSRAYRGASHTRRSFPAASRMIVPSIRAYSVLREEPGDVLIVGVCGDLEELDFCRIWRSRGGYLANSVGPRGVILCRRSDRYFPRLRSGRKAGNSRCRPPNRSLPPVRRDSVGHTVRALPWRSKIPIASGASAFSGRSCHVSRSCSRQKFGACEISPYELAAFLRPTPRKSLAEGSSPRRCPEGGRCCRSRRRR